MTGQDVLMVMAENRLQIYETPTDKPKSIYFIQSEGFATKTGTLKQLEEYLRLIMDFETPNTIR